MRRNTLVRSALARSFTPADASFMRAPFHIRERRASVAVFCAAVVLAIPTAVNPAGPAAGPTYLAGLAVIVTALWRGAAWLPRNQRGPWTLAAMAGTCWLLGDATQRVLEGLGHKLDVGPPDLFWVASYPLIIAAVLGMIRARGLPATLRREIRLDVVVVSAAAGVGAWHLIVAPSIDDRSSVLSDVVNVFYPLGDVAIFALGLTLVLLRGRRGTATLLFIACLGLTFPLDLLQAILPLIAHSFDTSHLDGALLVVNGCLGAAAVHPGRTELTGRTGDQSRPRLSRGRVVLLGTSLCAVSVVGAIPAKGAVNFLPSLIAGLVVSLAVVTRFYVVVRERETAEAALLYQVQHDHLTGAANRSLLMAHLTHGMHAQNQDAGETLALFVIDLDHFKRANDTWGHRAGDEILREVTRRLNAVVRQTDIVARVGGDEFVVVCHGMCDVDAQALGHRIREDLQRPIDTGYGLAIVGASVGVLTPLSARRPIAGGEWAADELLRRADSAMYEAKREGGGVRLAVIA
jgi:diguanylate cyclase (GGDEF)-like protein